MRRILLSFLVFCLVAPLSGRADQIQFLDHGELALSRLYQQIRSAKKSIDLTYYIWDPCHSVTKILTKELEAKAKAGVKVRLLVDADTHEAKVLRPMFTEFMRRKGIEVRYFNTGKGIARNFRTHVKMTVVDGESPQGTVVTGGRNIADDYFGLAQDNWIDRDVAATGWQAVKASERYQKLWGHRVVEAIDPSKVTDAQLKDYNKNCTKWGPKEDKLKAYLDKHAGKTVASVPVDTCKETKFLAELPGFVHLRDGREDYPEAGLTEAAFDQKLVTKAVYDLLNSAKKLITAENYTYMPRGKVEDIFNIKRKKNVEVNIYTNRFTAPDEIVNTPQNHFVKKHDKGTQQIHAISKLGVLADTWALTPKGADFMIHAKAFSVDGNSALVSSFNIDPRSYHTNLESGVLVKNCPAFAKRVQQASERTGRAWQRDQKDCVECNQINRQPWKTRAFQWLIFDLL